MRSSTQIKPISYLKANAAAVLDELNERRKPLIVTQNGEAKAVLQDAASYEDTQETMALLKILALGNKQIEQGKVKPMSTRGMQRFVLASQRLMRTEQSVFLMSRSSGAARPERR